MGRSRVAGQDPHRHAVRESGSGKFTKKPPADGDPSPPAAGGPTTDPGKPAARKRPAAPPSPPDPDRAGSGTGSAGGTGATGGHSIGRRLWSEGLGALRRG